MSDQQSDQLRNVWNRGGTGLGAWLSTREPVFAEVQFGIRIAQQAAGANGDRFDGTLVIVRFLR